MAKQKKKKPRRRLPPTGTSAKKRHMAKQKKKKPTLRDRQPLVADAITLLTAAGFETLFKELTPTRVERIALCLLGAANLKPGGSWSQAAVGSAAATWKPKTRDFISFWNSNYGLNLSSGSYDDVLRKGLVYLTTAGVVTSSHSSNNLHDGTRGYYISPAATDLIQKYGTAEWPTVVEAFVAANGKLSEKLAKVKGLRKTVVVQSGAFKPQYSDGVHGELLKAVVDEFLPRHARSYKVLFLEDNLYKYTPTALLKEYNLDDFGDRQAPDVLAVDKDRNLLFIFECAHSANPISAIRHLELTAMTAGCVGMLRRVFVTVLKDRKALKQFITDISWETEVWLADDPEHVIHFDGESQITSYDGSRLS